MSAIIYTKDIGEDIKYGKFAGVPRPQQLERFWRRNWELSGKEASVHKGVFWTSMDKSGARIIGCSPEEVVRYVSFGSYTGGWKANKRHGYGTRESYMVGSRYEGEWNQGMRHGQGTQWVRCRNGRGVRKFYAGSWVNDRREGYGTGCYEDGSFYHGNWVNDEREGEGLMFYANGDTYRGQWRQGKRSGLGILVVGETGDLYEGQWLNDKKEGSGRYYYRSRRKVMVGEWADDMCRTGSVSAYEDPIGLDIPTLRLKDIDGLLRSKMEEIRSERFLFRVLNTPLPDLFDSDDLTHIRDVHAAAVSNSQDGILSLVSLKALVLSLFGVQFSPEDLWELCVTVGVITEEEAQRAVVLTETELKAPPESSLPNDNREVIEHVIDSLTDDEDDEEEDEDATTELREQIAYRHFIIPSSAFTLDRFARIVTLILAKLNH